MNFKIITTSDHNSELHQVSRELSSTEILSSEIQHMIDQMVEIATTVVTEEGWRSAGLAAIQLGQPVRIFIAKDLRTDIFEIYINPRLELLGEAKSSHVEGCLSVPGVAKEVSRHKRVRVSYLDREGNPKVVLADGYQARILQHEYDHLNGVLFTDY